MSSGPEAGTAPGLLQAWRRARSLSQSALARRSGVSKAALSRWESGHRTPCAVELVRVLDALGVPAAERLTLWALLGHVDAARREAEALRAPAGTVICFGDVLREARWNLGWTQDEVAGRLGVGQGTVSKWERSSDRPPPTTAGALCDLLRISGREREFVVRGGVAALTFAPPPEGSNTRAASR